ncbi:hypothetical protein YPPY64_4375, partial [Yersinia pestis PY-64]
MKKHTFKLSPAGKLAGG